MRFLLCFLVTNIVWVGLEYEQQITGTLVRDYLKEKHFLGYASDTDCNEAVR